MWNEKKINKLFVVLFPFCKMSFNKADRRAKIITWKQWKNNEKKKVKTGSHQNREEFPIKTISLKLNKVSNIAKQ